MAANLRWHSFRRLPGGKSDFPPLGFFVIKPAAAYSIASFRFDITPPLQHPLLGGLVMPAVACDDALEAIGYVLTGPDAPIVVCALDWAGLMNDAHLAWRTALADAAGTTVDRVAVHCVHQHNAPFVCLEARRLAALQPDLPPMFDVGFFAGCLERAQHAVRAALGSARRITHVAHGQAEVRGVASNRRVRRDAGGRVLAMRQSACVDPALRALPEGTIDPRLQTVAFFSEGEKIVSCHYYATHPMSYYRDGRVTSDFCGLARARRQCEEPRCTHIYFTGCAGNVAAGKYNDGTTAARTALAERIYDGLVRSEAALVPRPLAGVEWRTEHVLPGASPDGEAMRPGDYGGNDPTTATRLVELFRQSWRQRVTRGLPLVLSSLHFDDVAILHLPGEMFVEYQLRAQALRSAGRPVAVAAYGDDGPWYIPTKEEYDAGGYEVSVAFCPREIDDQLTAAMRRLLD